MNKIVLIRAFPRILCAGALASLWFSPDVNRTWLWIVTALSMGDAIVFVLMRMWKAANVEITNDAVIVRGVSIDRRDIGGWRVIRASGLTGEPVRYIEFQLKGRPSSTVRWQLAKFSEPVPYLAGSERRIPVAAEPKIIARLNQWDMAQPDIAAALRNSEQFVDDNPS